MIAVRSITRQLALLFAVASTVILLAIGGVLSLLVHHHFEEQDVAALEARRGAIERMAGSAGPRPDAARLAAKLRAAFAGDPAFVWAVTDAAGTRLHVSSEVGFPEALANAEPVHVHGGQLAVPVTWDSRGRSYRGISHHVESGDGSLFVLLAIDTSDHREFMDVFRGALLASVMLGIAISFPFGWIAARRGMSPLRDVTRVAARVSASRLAERISLEAVPVELRSLAATFNDMLRRLEESFRRLTEFSSDLAHELRTPITNVMTETQVVLSRARGAGEYREVLYSNLEEFQGLARIVEDMLFLAKSDHGLVLPAKAMVDLGAEADALMEFFEALAAERGVTLVRKGEARIEGDRLMIRRALANLLSNAIRHSHAGEAVEIILGERAPGMVHLAVENCGPDIPEAHRARLFDRFYRIDASRGEGGAGLGLAITRAIVTAHRGRIDVRSAGGRTRFEMSLPAAAA